MKDSKEVKAAQKVFRKPSKVLETIITKIQRGRDGAIIEVGMQTRSGKILAIKKDKNFTGGMCAMTREGLWTAIPSIVLEGENDSQGIRITLPNTKR